MAATDARPSAPVKVVYGLGALGEAAFTTAMGFVFFYYTAALGFSGGMVGAALFLGLCADAIVDPFFGSWSDNIRSRFGRRIPLMLAGGPLLALSVGMLFAPPQELLTQGLLNQELAEPVVFVWLAFWAVAVRTFFSMFHVPYVALGAEMSGDYHERNSIVAWRTLFLILAGFLVNGLAYSVFFAGEGGLQQAGRYPAFGWAVAALVLFGAGLCAVGSAPYAARLPGVPPVDEHLLRRLPSEIVEIFRNRSFRVLFASAVLSYVGVGVNASFNSHAYVFVWQLRPELIQVVVFAFLGGLLVGVPLTPLVSRVVEKRTTVLIGMGLVVAAWMTIAFSRLAGAFTATGADAVLPLAVLIGVAGAGAGFCAIAYPSMMADAADEHEHVFGRRRRGCISRAWASLQGGAGRRHAGLGHGAGSHRLPQGRGPAGGRGPARTASGSDRSRLGAGRSDLHHRLHDRPGRLRHHPRRHAEVAAALALRRETAPAE